YTSRPYVPYRARTAPSSRCRNAASTVGSTGPNARRAGTPPGAVAERAAHASVTVAEERWRRHRGREVCTRTRLSGRGDGWSHFTHECVADRVRGSRKSHLVPSGGLAARVDDDRTGGPTPRRAGRTV